MEKMQRGNIITTSCYDSPCGTLLLGAYCDKLCMCDWLVAKHRNRVDSRLKRMLKAELKEGTSVVIERTRVQLDEYFNGKRTAFDVPLLPVGTDFQRKVWSQLFAIPFGKAVSYGDVARCIGKPKSVRAVANAVGSNALSILVPCHRVIGGSGLLTGYAGGLAAKRMLLALEGVDF